MVVARICARACFLLAYLFGRLSLLVAYLFGYLRGGVASVLPVVVRVDVARGTRGNVVRVNVVRVLLSFFWISSRLRESCLYAGLAHNVWFPFFPFFSHATCKRSTLQSARTSYSPRNSLNI
jgi:hypothetical protein